MNILYVSSVPYIGGAEISLLSMIAHLDHNRFTPFLLTSAMGDLAKKFEKDLGEVFFNAFPFTRKRTPWVFPKSIWDFALLIHKQKIDLLHVNCDRAVPFAINAGRLTATPVICGVRDLVRAWYQPRYVQYMNQSAVILANSKATAGKCVEAGMHKDKIRVIYPGIDTERFIDVVEQTRKKIRTEWGVAENCLLVGLVGAVLAYKGHPEFLHAAHRVLSTHAQVRFVVVGDHSVSDMMGYYQELLVLRKELGLEKNVIFAGYRNDIPAVMSAIDILAVPSYCESFGRVAVEAHAASRPVIATGVYGLAEIIDHEVSGLLIPPHDVTALAEAISRLVNDTDLRQRMGEQGRIKAQKFDVGAMTRLHEMLYEEII